MKPVSTSLFLLGVTLCAVVPAKAQYSWETRKPMTFYVAKGPIGSCGEGCSEWIAAEGMIGPNSATQLRTLLTRLGKEKPPIVFNSLGGLRSEALALGRLLRERAMTAGVGRTLVEGCNPLLTAPDAKCDALKHSGKRLSAELKTPLAECSSACLTALLGAKNRWINPGSHASIHAGKPTFRRGNQTSETGQVDKKALAQNEMRLRKYVREMGFKQTLVDAALKIPHDQGHYLTRDELINFGIDTRQAPKTPWILVRLSTDRIVVRKFFVESMGDSKKEFPTSLFEFSCSGSNLLSLNYFCGLSGGRSRTPRLELAAGPQRADLHFRESAKHTWIENQREFERYTAFPDRNFLENARSNGIELIETDGPSPSTRGTKISPAGLTSALDTFKCG